MPDKHPMSGTPQAWRYEFRQRREVHRGLSRAYDCFVIYASESKSSEVCEVYNEAYAKTIVESVNAVKMAEMESR